MATLDGIEPKIKPLSAEDLENLQSTSTEENHLPETHVEPSQTQTIKISKSHWKLLSRQQRGRTGKLKIIQKPQTELIPIWERRGQTEDQYFKREPRA